MPVAKIHVLEGRYDEARLGRVSNAVQQGLISALGIPPDDVFQIIHILPPTQFRHTRSFLGLNYSDDLILLEITFIAGRSKEKRLNLLKALNDAVVTAAKISLDDLLITLYETPGENISFGRGLAQRAHISESHMRNARELLEEFTAASFRDPKKAAEMFTADGAFEMPYLESVGVPGRYEGRDSIERFFRFVRDLYPDMDLENVKIMIDTPEQAFAEYEFTARSSKTGRTVHELFFGRLVAENGKIKLLRESVNLVELGLGVFPNGLADYKGSSERTA